MGEVLDALQVWGIWVLFVFVAWNVYRNVSLFSVLYFLYSKTPVGPFVHKRALAKSRKKEPHSEAKTVDCGGYVVRTVAYLSDNYAYIIEDKATGKCAVVDPADPERVLAEFQNHCRDRELQGATIEALLTTHHHMDHAGGNLQLKKALPGVAVYGGLKDRVAGATFHCGNGDIIKLGETTISVIDAPCHTKGHVVYHVQPNGGRNSRGSIFTGDMLFIAGCGKFFEGVGEQLARVTMETLPEMFGDTFVFCGHEYTVANAEFAAWVEPENEALQKLVKEAAAARDKRQPTVPSTIDDERLYNPFMRLDEPTVRAKTGTHASNPRGLVANILRSLKNRNVHKQSHAVESDRGRKWL